MLAIDIEKHCEDSNIPTAQNFEQWAKLAWQNNNQENTIEISLLIVDHKEMRALNKEWRHKDKATNVLSFPANSKPIDNNLHLGDIVICAKVVEEEAAQQEKTLIAHWAHLFIHGMLHLQNYDHIDADEAQIMETLEIELLAQLNIANPYIDQPIN